MQALRLVAISAAQIVVTTGGSVPAAPTGLTCTPGNNEVLLAWTAPSGTVTGYNVYRGTMAGTENVGAVTGTGGAAPAIARSLAYTYDNRSELTEESSADAGSGSYGDTYDWLFGYDLADNPQSFRATATVPAMYGFNVDNQTTSLLSGSLTAPIYDGDGGPTTYSSPSNGLTGGYAGATFSFDGENRLTASANTGSTYPFTAYYDGGGMRTKITVNNAATDYLYDDESGGGVPVAELTTSGTTTSLASLNGMCADG